MSTEQILNFALREGITALIALIVIYVAYRFVMLKLELVKKEFEERLKEKKFTAKGQFSLIERDERKIIFVDLNIEEKKETQ